MALTSIHRCTRFICLILAWTFLTGTAEAFLWFGDDPNDMPPAKQTELARPIYEKAIAAEEAGKIRRAKDLYEDIWDDYPAADFAAQSLYKFGYLEYQDKEWEEAFEAFQKVLAYHPDFPRFNEIVNYQFKIALALARGDNVRFLWIIPYKAHKQSAQYFEIIIGNAPYNDLAPLALMNVALIRQHKGDTAEAIDALDRLINNYPTSLLADDAYLSLAETFAGLVQGPQYDQGATREAMSYFEDFLILFSQNEKVSQAEQGLAGMEEVYARSKFVIGEYYYEHRGWYFAAEIFFNEAITIAPDSEAAAQARDYLQQIETFRNNMPDQNEEPSEDERSFIRRFFDRLIS